MSDKLQIDFVSDVVCPWCIIGLKQLERALEVTGTEAEIHFHPFELNPQMAPGGENLREHLAAKYGTTPGGSRQARERLTALGDELGFAFSYADDMRMVNTFRAHQLIHWADTLGRGPDLKMALFKAFFTDNHDLNDVDVLVENAAEIGLDPEEARAVLEDGRFADAVRQEEQLWVSRGIQGVPAVILNQRYLVSGAQGVDNFSAIVKQVSEEQAA